MESASAVPVMVGVLSLVGDETETAGALGTAVSTTKVIALLAGLVFPAESLTVAVSE